MNLNPYEPPRPDLAPTFPQPQGLTSVNRTPFLLAAIGAWLASGYWALLTLLLVLGVAKGGTSGGAVILPCILIFLYASRGLQLYRGEPAAVRRILWLHGIGGVAAVLQVLPGSGIIVVLQSVKITIHIFGAIMAIVALRALKEARLPVR